MNFRAIGFILLLAGCAHVPNHDLAEVQTAPELDQSTEYALERNFFEEGGWPSEKWWEMFRDPQLDRIMEIALYISPTLQKAFAKVEEVRQQANRERAPLLPHLNLQYTENWEYFSKNGFVRSFYPITNINVPATVNDIDLSLNFNYEFDFFGRHRKRFEEALGKSRAEKAEAQAATLVLTTLIAQTYVELQTKMAQRKVLEQYLDQKHALYTLAAQREKNGLDPYIPVLEKQSGIYEIDQSLIVIDKEIAIDTHALNRLVGVGPNDNLITEEMAAILEEAFPLPTQLSSNLLARRPDLTAQLWRVEAAAKSIGAAKADFYPRINLIAMAGLESLAFNKLFHISSKEGALEPAVYLPIFTGGRLRANLREKVAQFNEATYHYNELLLLAATDVADQITILSSTYDRLSSQLINYQTAEDQLNLHSLRYENAVSNFLTVLESEETVLEQQNLLLGYERDYLLAAIKLIKALGGGYLAGEVATW